MKKNKKKLFGYLFLIISYLLFFLSIKFIPFIKYSIHLLMLFSIFSIYIFLHFMIDIKKMYNFIYLKRYLIGFLILVFLVVFKFNGSSSKIWNNIIEPHYQVKDSVVFGKVRPIRSDEWLVSTPMTLTQTKINYSSINNILSAKENNVTLYPNLPSKDISILSTPNNIGYLFLDVERAFSLSWYLPYFILLFSTFELLMIITKKNKLLSITGAIMITISPVVQWWQSASIIGYGALACVIFNLFLNQKKVILKLIYSILFGYTGFLYIMCLYPAWQVPYGYCFLVILIYLLIINKKGLNFKLLIYLIPVLFILCPLLYLIFSKNMDTLEIMNNTVYPGNRVSSGGGEYRTLFTYIVEIFFPYVEIKNPCEISQFISFYPFVTLYCIYVMIKNKKKDLFLIMTSIIIIFLSIWVLCPLPKIISKMTLMSMSTETRCQVAIGYLSVIQLIYILSEYSTNKKLSKKRLQFNLLISFICIAVSTFLLYNFIKIFDTNYLNPVIFGVAVVIYTLLLSLILVNKTKVNNVLSLLLILISLVSSLFISPISKGLDVYYKKPIVKELSNILKDKPESIFIVVDSGFTLANYISTSGAKTINTVNYLPNLELYHLLDKDLKYENVYNRYEHVSIELTNDDTSFYLNQDDLITIYLNYEDLCLTKANYLVTMLDDDSKYSRYKKRYDKDNIKIYETGC